MANSEAGVLAPTMTGIAPCIAAAGAALNAVAKRLGLGARTLQRRLRDGGLAYNDIVEQVRQEVSFRHLRREDLQISEIAVRLGYSEVSAFDRAFRRWSGTSPLAFRRATRRRS